VEAAQHNAALRQVVLTSALKGVGIADLRADLATLVG
jgi:hypothetical protein